MSGHYLSPPTHLKTWNGVPKRKILTTDVQLKPLRRAWLCTPPATRALPGVTCGGAAALARLKDTRQPSPPPRLANIPLYVRHTHQWRPLFRERRRSSKTGSRIFQSLSVTMEAAICGSFPNLFCPWAVSFSIKMQRINLSYYVTYKVGSLITSRGKTKNLCLYLQIKKKCLSV